MTYQPLNLDPDVQAALYGRLDLYTFLTEILGYPDYQEKTHAPMTLELMSCGSGGKMMTLWPRNTFKSTTAIVGYPLWLLSQFSYICGGPPHINPTIELPLKHWGDIRIAIISSTKDRANDFLDEGKGFLEDEDSRFNQLYRGPDNRLLKDISANWKWKTGAIECSTRLVRRREATLSAYGILSLPIGYHWDIIIADDIVDQALVRHKSYRDDVWNTGFLALLPMLAPGGRLIMIGTRWHKDDVYGRIERKVRKAKRKRRANKRITGTDKRLADFIILKKSATDAKTGEILFPQIFTQDFLDEQKEWMGTHRYACNYEMDPNRDESKPFKNALWISPDKMPQDQYEFAIFVDPNNSLSPDSDWTAILAVAHGLERHLMLVLDAWMGHLLADMVAGHVFEMACRTMDYWMRRLDFRAPGFREDNRKPLFRGVACSRVLFESLLMNEYNDKMLQENRFFPLIPLPIKTTAKAKDTRIRALAPRFAAHGVLWNMETRHSEHMQIAKDQVFEYPSSNDDAPDALSQCNNVFFRIYRAGQVTAADDVHRDKTDAELHVAKMQRIMRADQEKALTNSRDRALARMAGASGWDEV